MFDLDPVPSIISFDCYGTLVQWREVLLAEFDELQTRTPGGIRVDSATLLDTFSCFSRQFERDRPHRLYKEVFRLSLKNALDQYGIGYSGGDFERVAESIKTMGPHPEVPGVLRKLRSRYKLAIFTNSDEDLIVHNVERLGVPTDYVITAERAQAYKPSRQIFEYAHKAMGVTKDETVHVAMSMILDMQACHELGFRGVWINRLGQAGNPDWLPYVELPDLTGVPKLLGIEGQAA
ncbi:haloacid dehalogenase type II [Rhizobiaceae bacterium n13]|uniref:Haloacid dehalogenase type II n=1 Tax=Ferirhizobium litorale TaxID=2927786 RepID=A0AAE3QEJ1_9HYPH|nr:haloacid dehalogenase type II [Fererhizobium litorale]MDI7862724.1 haloacid dehalogenase type II [Fererhizobium litorale]MDI7924412.1 haloacid dehalogenase type II [Fererhizobium litorale]